MARLQVATIFLLLVHFSNLTYATRLELTIIPPETEADSPTEALADSPTEAEVVVDAVEVDCDGASEEMRLMMKKTVDAHVNHIYTPDQVDENP